MISFEDIFALYMDHFRGKVLSLVCDCSYSHSWVEQCAKKLDGIGIPSCGHHTREQGILMKVYCSCKDDQQATMLAYCEEGVFVKEGTLWYQINKTLSENQQTMGFDFTNIQCGREKECEVPAHHTWIDRTINSSYVYLVKGDDKGKPAWYYVLVDKKKVNPFKVQLAAEMMDLEEYGHILCSGYGQDPPEEKKKQIENQFIEYQKRE